MMVVMALSLLAMSAEADIGSLPVYVEDSPAAQERIEEADQLLVQDRVSEAVERLQQVIEQYNQKLIPIAPGRFMDAGRYTQQRIVGDPVLWRAYRRRYDAAAERALVQARETQGPQRAEAFDAVLRQYGLTAAGLEAALDRVALYLEQADSGMARNLLDGVAVHPQLDDHRIRYHLLGAVAAIFEHDNDGLKNHRLGLSAAGATDTLDRIDLMQEGLVRSVTLDRAEFELPDVVDQPLWEVAIESPASDAGVVNPRNASRRMQAINLPTMMGMQPVVADDDVLISNGHSVRSLDRFSGRTRWILEDAESDINARTLAAMRGHAASIPAGVRPVVAGRRVHTILGSISGWPMRAANHSTQTWLYTLDRDNGRPIWSVTPAELDPALERAFFHGTPRVGLDRVYVMLRRTQLTGFQDAFVAALDANTGRLLWKRHISSTATANRYGVGSLPSMTLNGHSLYVSDQLGAVAAIDVRDGGFHWMRVFDIDAQANADGQANLVTQFQPSQRSAPRHEPMIVPAGLVVGLIRDSAGLLLLDPKTGETLAQLNDEPIGGHRQLLSAEDRILAVDRLALTLYDGESLDPIWETQIDALEEDRNEVFAGRPDVVGQRLAIGTGSRLLVFSLVDGELLDEVGVTGPGNVVMADDELLFATTKKVAGFIDWDRAYRRLADRAAVAPTDPRIGLAMAHLGMNRGRGQAMLEGVDWAAAALAAERSMSSTLDSRRVFDEVVALIESESQIDIKSKAALFDRLAALASDPSQEAVYHLSFGAFLAAQGRIEDAVEQYQFILLDESLASQLYRRPTLTRQAGLEARGRIDQLIAVNGPGVYGVFDRLAAQRLMELSNPEALDPEALARLADRYPASHVAPEALYRAGRAYGRMGEPVLAIRHLRRAYRMASDPSLSGQIVGELVGVHVELGQPQVAAHWLRRTERDHPGLVPVRDGRSTPIDLWLMELSMIDRIADNRPRIDLPLGKPFEVEGTLILPMSRGIIKTSTTRFMTRQGSSVAMYFGGSTTPSWKAELENPHAELLLLTDQQAIFWSDDTARLIAFDAETGRPAWDTVDVDAVLDRAGEARQREDMRPREQRQFVLDLNPAGLVVRNNRLVLERHTPPRGYLIAANDAVICVADRAGRVTAIDRATGEPLWQQLGQIDELNRIAIDDQHVALSGTTFPDTPTESHAILVLDAISGATQQAPIETNEPIRWMGFDDDGHLISVGDNRVTLRDPETAQVSWRLDFVGRKSGDQNWIGNGLLLMVTETDTAPTRVLVAIDTRTGRLLNRFALSSGRGTPVYAHRLEEEWIVNTSDAVFSIDSAGGRQWRDILQTRGTTRIDASGVTDRYAVVASSEEDDQWVGVVTEIDILENGRIANEPLDPPRRQRLWLLDRVTGRLLAEHAVGETGSALWRLLPLERRLVVGSLERTMVFPGAGELP